MFKDLTADNAVETPVGKAQRVEIADFHRRDGVRRAGRDTLGEMRHELRACVDRDHVEAGLEECERHAAGAAASVQHTGTGQGREE